jgi:hypothetical protein
MPHTFTISRPKKRVMRQEIDLHYLYKKDGVLGPTVLVFRIYNTQIPFEMLMQSWQTIM